MQLLKQCLLITLKIFYMICVSLGIASCDDAIKLSSKVQMFEYRADLLKWTEEEYIKIIGLVPNSLFTCRPGVKTDHERLELYRFAIENGVDYIDVEMEAQADFLSSIQSMIKNTDTDLILSYHNFDLTPDSDELGYIHQTAFMQGADLVKIACMVNDQADAARLLSLYQLPGRKVVIGMGESGKIVRLASVFLGAEFTFASIDKGLSTAPGQMTWQEMEKINEILNSAT